MQLKVLNGTLKGQLLSMSNVEVVSEHHPYVSARLPKLYMARITPILQFPRGSIMPNGVNV